ncbi:MAG: phosphoglycerate kinase [Candidatus Taylorbacteria bacterium]|nr:phosphoglycerate kinase [Candidatus Taylorbacteria bacterium]
MKFTFVRHGETDYNKRKVMTGQYDAPLNEEGKEQARLETERLPNDFDVIFSSSLSRARETADIINQNLNLPIVITDLITERDFGSLVGKTWDEMESGYIPNARKIDKEQKYDYRPFGGESAEQVSQRLSKFIEDTKTGSYKNPLVVCHGGIIRMLYAREGKAFEHIENAVTQEFDL